jgi:DNA-binding beta-propeller fold protein YncE
MSESPSLKFEPVPAWEQLPAGWRFVEVAGVAMDADDRVYVFNRGDHPVIIFDRDGRFLSTWGEGLFTRPHGITIGPDGTVYCLDDMDHTVKIFTPEGKLKQTLGTSGQPSDTGATSIDFRTIKYAGPPFHYPTNLAIAADGSLYIADGYGNARVHKFSPEGKYLFSWGEPGAGPGQFHVPHGIAINGEGTIIVADRENSRLQFFDPEGKFLTEWTDLARPSQVTLDRSGNLYVTELGYRAGMWPGTTAPSPDATGGRVSVLDPSGRVLARWGGGLNPTAPGDFYAPHDIRLDSRGDVYVGEVVWSAGANCGHVSPECHALQKFRRVVD